jgi:hypothetical protein
MVRLHAADAGGMCTGDGRDEDNRMYWLACPTVRLLASTVGLDLPAPPW